MLFYAGYRLMLALLLIIFIRGDEMREFGIFILAVSLWLLLNTWVDSHNPCSQFSDRPELCSSDGVKE